MFGSASASPSGLRSSRTEHPQHQRPKGWAKTNRRSGPSQVAKLIGDLFMSLIHTCQLCGANSFDYLVELQRHSQELAACPTEWMPWNYRETLARIGVPDSAEL